jgi:type I restriction enzyme M protein
MTLSIAKALMESAEIRRNAPGEYERDGEYLDNFYNLLSCQAVLYMQQIGRQHPNCGYGQMFWQWIFSDTPRPYGSYGNGAAMRISPVGFFARSEAELKRLSAAVTAVSHNHPEGLKGAEATAMAIFLARGGASKTAIRKRMTEDYYTIDFTIDGLRGTYEFDATCQNSVPQALEAFFEADSFEDTLRTAISLGGDSDTIAAITGGIAEAYYGVSEELKAEALQYLDPSLRRICEDWAAWE